MWDWYFKISDCVRRVRDGVCEPIPPTEIKAWIELTGEIVYPSEYAILCAIDVAYCSEMNKELADYRVRERDEADTKAAKATKRRR